jgi:UDP-glucose 4-epimerase
VSNPGTSTVSGQIKSADAIYTSLDITGATINGHANIPNGTTIVSSVSDANTDALISAVISNATTTSTIAVNTQLTISESIQSPIGYYLKFNSPVPLGKVVTVLHGFDK